MAQNAISINILSNVREAVSGVSDVGDAVDDVDKQLRDLTKEGSTSTDRMEADFRSVAKAADRTADDLKSKFRAAYKDVRSSSSDAADAAETSYRRMKDKGAEVGSEIRQNLGEGLANAARGDFSQLGDTIGDTLGGITAGIGGVATAGAGLAAALGIGAIVAAFQAANAEAEKLKQKAGEWADKYIEAGGRVLTFDQQLAAVRQILTDPEKYKEAQDAAKLWGVSEQTAAEALAGMPVGIDAVQTSVDKLRTAYLNTLGPSGQMVDEFGNLNGRAAQAQKKYLDAKSSLDTLTGAMDLGARQADIYSETLRYTAEHTAGAKTETDKFGDSITTLPNGKQIYIDAETQQATMDVDAIKNQIYSIPQTWTTRLHLDTSDFDRKWADTQQKLLNGVNVKIGGQGQYWKLID